MEIIITFVIINSKIIFMGFDIKSKSLDVDSVVCEYFGIDVCKLVSKSRASTLPMARGFCWYILHFDYGYSYNKLSKMYKRSIRNINIYVTKLKYLIENQKAYKEMYEGIKKGGC